MSGSSTGTNVFILALILSFFLVLFYGIEFILGFALEDASLRLNFCYSIAPSLAFPLFFVTTCLGTSLNLIGGIGLALRKRGLTLSYLCTSTVVSLLALILFVFLIMAQYGTVVLSKRNTNSNELDREVDVNNFADDTQELIVRFAVENPDDFTDLQNDFSCCGLNVQAMFGFGIEDFNFSTFHSGQQCFAALEEINDFFVAAGDEFNDEALELVEDFPVLSGVSFFCEADFASFTRTAAQDIAIVIGIQGFLQVALTFTLGLLLYVYDVSEGGLKADEDDIAARPKVENTILVKAGYSKENKVKGEEKYSTITRHKKGKGKPSQNTGNQHIRFG